MRYSSRQFRELDEAGISALHWKIMFISGMGFFTGNLGDHTADLNP